MRLIILISCLFFLACNSDSTKPAENDTENTSNKSSADQEKAEENIKEYAASHSKGKPEDFKFGKLKKSKSDYEEEMYVIRCSFKETYDDGGNPMNMKDDYYLDKDFNVVRVDYSAN